MENLRWKEGTPSQFISNLLLFLLTVFGKSLSTTNPQLALARHRGVVPSLTGVAVKRLIISRGGLVEESL